MVKLAAMLRLDKAMIMIPENSFVVPVLMCPGLRWENVSLEGSLYNPMKVIPRIV